MSSSSFPFLLFSLFLFVIHPTFSQSTIPSCKSLKFSNRTFANCNDLPTLNAVLHWTYNPSNSSLSMAFTAKPSQPNGWVAWGLNPNGKGMAGAQALLALKTDPSSPITVSTYDIKSYGEINKGPISFKVGSLLAEETGSAYTIFGTWELPTGQAKFNQIWQVGPVTNGKISKHEFAPPNLGAKQVLSLSGSTGPAASPSGTPSDPTVSPLSSAPSGAKIVGSAPAPGSGENAGERLVSSALALGALAVSFMF